MRTRLSLVVAAFLVTALAGPRVAAAEKLQLKVMTATPDGFLVTSTLVSGAKDAVLVDSMMTMSDAHRVVADILESKKNLTTIYVTHGHPDHYFGLVVLRSAFPKAKIVALPSTIAAIKKTWRGKVKQWGPMFGANLTTKPFVPRPLKGTTITLEGETLEIVGPVQGDDAHNSYVWIPSIKAVIAGDVVYDGVYVWTAETDAAARTAWIGTLDKIAALGPTTVVAGHQVAESKQDPKNVEATKQYLQAFDAALAKAKNADDLVKAMKAKYPKLALDVILTIGANAAFPAAAPPPSPP